MKTPRFLERLLAKPTTDNDGLPIKLQHPKHREFVVVGLGRFGASVARSLVQFGHGVLAIDRDPARVQQLSMDLPHVVALDATNIEALKEVGIGHFETGLSCIGADFESNLLSCVLMRRLGVQKVIAKARTRTQREVLLQIGADEVILPEHEAGVRLARRLAAIDFVDYLSLGNDVGIIELCVPSRYVGKTLSESAIRNVYNLTVVAVRRENDVFPSPAADFEFCKADELLVLGKFSDAERFV
jgi:trk system potassium uptake protein TrkA